ncbi:TetR/AcrR family transcriptional regulator [Nocardia harenae]|uniref:TetR/AcrR family transcriptional regulator n=1 Tax=Nocardia harenae TaxID=358707 RepID=UPI0008349B5A|nr:TetR/AcrR family transcriptional regulator [Nocardia harenae]
MTATADSRDLSRKDRILAVAVREFAAKGFAAVRVDEIAQLADCNKALIYYHFGSKEGLYNAVFETLIPAVQQFWDLASQTTVANWFEMSAEWARRSDTVPWSRLMVMEGLDDRGPGSVPLEEERIESLRHQTELVVRAQQRGELDPALDPEMMSLTFTLWPLLPRIFPQFVRMVTGYGPDDPEFAARMQQFISDVITRLRAPEN